jgi:hypothetical protein
MGDFEEQELPLPTYFGAPMQVRRGRDPHNRQEAETEGGQEATPIWQRRVVQLPIETLRHPDPLTYAIEIELR